MGRVLPILFITDMVMAILDGLKDGDKASSQACKSI